MRSLSHFLLLGVFLFCSCSSNRNGRVVVNADSSSDSQSNIDSGGDAPVAITGTNLINSQNVAFDCAISTLKTVNCVLGQKVANQFVSAKSEADFDSKELKLVSWNIKVSYLNKTMRECRADQSKAPEWVKGFACEALIGKEVDSYAIELRVEGALGKRTLPLLALKPVRDTGRYYSTDRPSVGLASPMKQIGQEYSSYSGGVLFKTVDGTYVATNVVDPAQSTAPQTLTLFNIVDGSIKKTAASPSGYRGSSFMFQVSDDQLLLLGPGLQVANLGSGEGSCYAYLYSYASNQLTAVDSIFQDSGYVECRILGARKTSTGIEVIYSAAMSLENPVFAVYFAQMQGFTSFSATVRLSVPTRFGRALPAFVTDSACAGVGSRMIFGASPGSLPGSGSLEATCLNANGSFDANPLSVSIDLGVAQDVAQTWLNGYVPTSAYELGGHIYVGLRFPGDQRAELLDITVGSAAELAAARLKDTAGLNEMYLESLYVEIGNDRSYIMGGVTPGSDSLGHFTAYRRENTSNGIQFIRGEDPVNIGLSETRYGYILSRQIHQVLFAADAAIVMGVMSTTVLTDASFMIAVPFAPSPGGP